MKKIYITCALLLLTALSFQSQNNNWSWARAGLSIDNVSDEATSTAVDIYGNVYITGSFNGQGITFTSSANSVTLTNSDNTTSEIFVAKYDAAGNLLWAKSAMGNGGHDRGLAIAADAAGNAYVTGYFESPALVVGSITLANTTTTNSADMFVAKYDAMGNVVYASRHGGSLPEWGTSIVADATGNVYVAGFFHSLSIGFGTVSCVQSGNGDAFIAKLNTAGMGLWANQTGGSGFDAAWGLGLDVTGDVSVAGTFESGVLAIGPGPNLINAGGSDVYFAKYSSNGNNLMAQSFGGPGEEDVWDIESDIAGNMYLVGRYDSNPLVIGTTTLSKIGQKDFYTAGFAPNGTSLWARKHIGNNFSSPAAVSSDLFGNIYVTGHVVNLLPLSIGATTLSATSGGSPGTGGYIIKYNALTGLDLWNTTFEADPGSIDLDLYGNIHIAGDFGNTLILGPDTLQAILQSDPFVAKMCNLPIITGTNITVCAGLTGSVGIIVPPGFIPNWFDAATGGSLILPGSNTITSTSSGTFYIELTDTITGCGYTGPRTAISISVVPGASVSLFGDSLLANVPGLVSIQWYDCIYGTIMTAEHDPVFFPPVNSSYAVIATFGNCVDTSDCFLYPPVGIQKNSAAVSWFNIRPNPSNGHFEINTSQKGTYALVNMLGQNVRTIKIEEASTKVDVSGLQKGVYFITDGKTKEKIIITE